ncbi:MAG: GIY-YIG nuclease family protein, partial [Ignavibacteriales bacterium]
LHLYSKANVCNPEIFFSGRIRPPLTYSFRINDSMFYVYILLSKKDNNRYIGFTEDLARRLNEHNSGLVKSTSNRRPLELIYYEECDTKLEAMNQEKDIKSKKGKFKIPH